METTTNDYTLHKSLFMASQLTHLLIILKTIGTLHLDYPQMAMESSPIARHLLGPSSFSSTTFPLNFASHAEHILALGVIPGPNKPARIDSFLIPLQEELYQLAKGVEAHDIQTKQLFLLHAFLLIIFADFPAIAMLMNMKGVNGISPCRNCKIKAIPVPGDTTSTHHVPLTTNLTNLG